jgi:uncharacterized protein
MTMSIRATLFAGVLGLPLLAGSPLFAEAPNLSLAQAAKLGNAVALRSLLNGLAKEDVAGAQGTAALIWAASRNDVEMTDLLLAAGADPKSTNEYGATALYAAAANRDPAITVKLLAAGADPNAALAMGETPLMEAALRGNLDTVRALLAAGADPSAQEKQGGQTVLMWAASRHHSAVTEELVEHKADVNARSKNGSTALMFAAQQDDVISARALLKAGANPNEAIPEWGHTALIIASTMGKTDVVKVLVENGAAANMPDRNGFTPLHAAIRDSDYGENRTQRATAVAIVKVLLAHGANANIRLKQEKPSARTPDEIELQGATPLALAAEVNNLDAIKALMEAGADPNIATEKGTTPLMLASGAGTDVQRPRSLEERALAIETAKFLVDHGADVNAAGQFGWTALHAASYQGLNDVVEFLASKGAKLDTKDELGQTPLSISLSVLTKEAGARRLQIPRRYRAETAQLLLRLGATPLNKSGVNAVLQRNGDLTAGLGE